MPRTAFIVGMEEFGLPSEGHRLTARDRAARVLVRHGDALGAHYSAGAEHPPGVPRWPPDDVPVLERRRIPEDRRLDRTDADPPIAWRVDVQVESRATDYGTLDDLVARRAELEVAAAAAARIEVPAGWRAEPAAVPLA